MPTVKDVAERAGVSVATVSRVLTQYPHVALATRQRVLQAVEELDYRPDQVARSLRRRQSNLIGLIVSTIENTFFTEVAHAAERAAREHGYNLIVCNTDENPRQEAVYLDILDKQLSAGIILAPAPGDAAHLFPFIEKGPPVVLINRRIEQLPCTSITSNDGESAYACVQHLLQAGRRRIAAIVGLPGVYTTRLRLAGYRRALVDAGIVPNPALEVAGAATMEGGYWATRKLLQPTEDAKDAHRERPDAIFAFNNVMTHGAVAAIYEQGLRWPDQIGVSGFGAFKTACLYRPPLTLVQQPTHAMGRRAVEELVRQIESPTPVEEECIVLQNQLVSSGTLSFTESFPGTVIECSMDAQVDWFDDS